MNTIMEDINKQKQKQYNKAREDLIKAKDSFDKLDNIQKQQLVEELVGLKTASEFLQFTRTIIESNRR